MVNVSRENRRYGRVIIEKGLRVSMRSIGSEASYNMETRNVSDTGFFLRFEKPGRFPFTPSSIIEVWLTLEEGSTIFFNGRMTRVVHPEEAVSLDTEPGIAIRIIQIEKEEERVLRDFIKKKAMENEDKEKSAAPASPKNEVEMIPPPPAGTVPSPAELVPPPPAEAAPSPIRKKTRRKTTTARKTAAAKKKTTRSKANDSKKAASIEDNTETPQQDLPAEDKAS